ncbi:MAG: helix-turn-helix transcriptional regulator [Firmicutes bacterium]|nr:helix-turn-helix transcriptional regulator [Bacillota bacterium]
MRIRKESDELQEEEILLIANVSDALAHPVRIKIFRYIMKCNTERQLVCNKDIVADFDYSQATISQHIKKLQQAQLVQIKKKNKFSYYFVNIGILGQYVKAVNKFD